MNSDRETWEYEPAQDLGLPPGERLRSLRRENGLFENGLQALWWLGIGAYLRLYHRLRIDGREGLPAEPPFILVANHQSHLDALCLAAALRFRLRSCLFPIAAGDHFFATPTTSWFAACVFNALPMWRRNCGRHALVTLRERLGDGNCCYVLFPEGTRSRTGVLGSFRPGIGTLIAGSDVPVVPCHLTGAFGAYPPDRTFPRPRAVRLRIGTPMTFAGVSNDRAGWQQVARELETAVRGLGPDA